MSERKGTEQKVQLPVRSGPMSLSLNEEHRPESWPRDHRPAIYRRTSRRRHLDRLTCRRNQPTHPCLESSRVFSAQNQRSQEGLRQSSCRRLCESVIYPMRCRPCYVLCGETLRCHASLQSRRILLRSRMRRDGLRVALCVPFGFSKR